MLENYENNVEVVRVSYYKQNHNFEIYIKNDAKQFYLIVNI